MANFGVPCEVLAGLLITTLKRFQTAGGGELELGKVVFRLGERKCVTLAGFFGSGDVFIQRSGVDTDQDITFFDRSTLGNERGDGEIRPDFRFKHDGLRLRAG